MIRNTTGRVDEPWEALDRIDIDSISTGRHLGEDVLLFKGDGGYFVAYWSADDYYELYRPGPEHPFIKSYAVARVRAWCEVTRVMRS